MRLLTTWTYVAYPSAAPFFPVGARAKMSLWKGFVPWVFQEPRSLNFRSLWQRTYANLFWQHDDAVSSDEVALYLAKGARALFLERYDVVLRNRFQPKRK